MASENEQSQVDGDWEDMDLADFFIPDAKLWEVWSAGQSVEYFLKYVR